MAVTIDIPGFGRVSAENAASESTLRDLVIAVQSQSSAFTNVNRVANQGWRDAQQSARSASSSMQDAAAAAGRVTQETSNSRRVMQSLFVDLGQNEGMIQASLNRTGAGLQNLAATLVNIGATLTTQYRQIAKDPIGTSAQLLSTGIDLVTKAASKAGPIILGGIGAAFDGIRGAIVGVLAGTPFGSKLIEVMGEGLKVANSIMAEEMKGTIASFQQLSQQGVVFSQGMTQMRIAAGSAGLTIDQFSSAVAKSDRYLRNMGDGLSGSAQKVVEVSQYFDMGGGKIRTELLKLGYSYEEQYELTARYMSQLSATTTAQQRRAISDQELAQRTRDYAADLKVLSTFTKEDANAAMEAARAKSMEADIMAQLGPEQGMKFQKMLSALPESAKKGFMEFVSTGGAVVDQATNIAMSQNEEFAKLITESGRMLLDPMVSDSEAMDAVLEQRAKAGEAQREMNREQGNAIAQVSRLTGAFSEATGIINDLSADIINPESVKEARDSVDQLTKTIDPITTSAVALQKSSQEFAVTMQDTILPYMEHYGKILQTTNEATLTFGKNILQMITGENLQFEGDGVVSGESTIKIDYDALAAQQAAIRNDETLTDEEKKSQLDQLLASFDESLTMALHGVERPAVTPEVPGFTGRMVTGGMRDIATGVYNISSKPKEGESKAILTQIDTEQLDRLISAQNDNALVTVMREWVNDAKAIADVQRSNLAQIRDYSKATAESTDKLAKEV